jgi:uncharacterized protein with HEPN domain
MAERRPKLLFDAISAMDAAQAFLQGKTLDDYASDLLLRSAVERQLEILGEACARLGREHPALFTEFPDAQKAVSLRNRIIHGYDTVDDETLFDTVVNSLPVLRTALHGWLLRLTHQA